MRNNVERVKTRHYRRFVGFSYSEQNKLLILITDSILARYTIQWGALCFGCAAGEELCKGTILHQGKWIAAEARGDSLAYEGT
jgi:hypothetical protein